MVDLTLRLKPYLQPFEIVLAQHELKGLAQRPINMSEDGKAIVNDISSEVANSLLRRLSYFDQALADENDFLTQQSLREISQTEHPGSESKLPRSRRLRFGAHDIHEYRGKFFPQLVRALINQTNLPHGSIVCDPMSGSGTTALESADLGMNFIGTDINPLSIVLTEAKSRLASGLTTDESKAAKAFIDDATYKTDDGATALALDQKTLTYLLLWFPEDVLFAILTLRQAISGLVSLPRVHILFEVVLSNIIRKVSHQVEDDLRVRKGESKHNRDSVHSEFAKEALRQIGLLERINAVYGNYEDLSLGASVQIRPGDARFVQRSFPEFEGQVDCVITSPPYATALPYLDTDRLSLLTLGLIEKSDLKALELQMIGTREISERQRREWWQNYESSKHLLTDSINDLIARIAETNHGDGVGFRRRNLPALLGKYFLDMRQNLTSALAMLKPSSFAFYVVGSNSTKLGEEKLIIQTDKLLFELAENVGFEAVDYLNMDLLSSRDVFRENRGSSESLLTLRKPIHG